MTMFNEDVKIILRFNYSLINFENTKKKMAIIFYLYFCLYLWPEINYLPEI